MSLAQMQRKHTSFDNVDTLQQIRLELKFRGITDQARITIDHHLAYVFLLAHQQAHLTTVLTG